MSPRVATVHAKYRCQIEYWLLETLFNRSFIDFKAKSLGGGGIIKFGAKFIQVNNIIAMKGGTIEGWAGHAFFFYFGHSGSSNRMREFYISVFDTLNLQ